MHKAKTIVTVSGSNQAFIELKNRRQAGAPRTIDKTVANMEGLAGASGANLIYAGYPYDPYA
jgi:hypothetical protein